MMNSSNNFTETNHSGRFSIELTGLHFYARHGLYAEEQVLGNEFRVNISVDCAAPGSGHITLEQTINYVKVYEIVKLAFEKPTALLENCALRINDGLQSAFANILNVEISIKKLSPPITGFQGSVGVRYSFSAGSSGQKENNN